MLCYQTRLRLIYQPYNPHYHIANPHALSQQPSTNPHITSPVFYPCRPFNPLPPPRHLDRSPNRQRHIFSNLLTLRLCVRMSLILYRVLQCPAFQISIPQQSHRLPIHSCLFQKTLITSKVKLQSSSLVIFSVFTTSVFYSSTMTSRRIHHTLI